MATNLRLVIEDASASSGHSLSALSVLSDQNDPYRIDTEARRRDGAWLANAIDQHRIKVPVHLRGLHYVLVATSTVRKPDGSLYVNTDECWEWLSTRAAKVARWLGYVPFESIVDNRNEEPKLFVPEDFKTTVTLEADLDLVIPGVEALIPKPALDFTIRQPNRIVLIGEKSSLQPVLLPIARRVEGELILPTGEMSDTLIYGIAKRAAEDGRPLRVFYFADFDPSGFEMAINVARKLMALRDLHFPSLDIEMHRVALTAEQVAELGLPSTPLKATEKRGDKWRERWNGQEQTEIDALAALRPDALTAIAWQAINPFWDKGLWYRTYEAKEAWLVEAQAVVDAHIGEGPAAEPLRRAAEILDQMRALLEELHQDCTVDASLIELPEFDQPKPKLAGQQPVPLYSSVDTWTDATLKLAADKIK